VSGPEPRSAPARSRRWWIAGLAIAALVVVGAALLASADPDGLEWVAGEQGFLGRARDALVSILPGYAVPGLEGSASTIVAGLLGIGIVVVVVVVVGRLVVRRPR
jgi:hypothetical protein